MGKLRRRAESTNPADREASLLWVSRRLSGWYQVRYGDFRQTVPTWHDVELVIDDLRKLYGSPA